MNPPETVERLWTTPLGRALLVAVGVALVAAALLAQPGLVPVVQWVVPVSLVGWGCSRFYRDGISPSLSAVAGGLLVVGGLTQGLFLLVPMGELGGTLANGVPAVAVLADLFVHRRGE